jgi:processive 1,2-diacylglycerol beta-glucosyltransferase
MHNDTRSQTVLVFSVPAGHGHIRPAEALCTVAARAFPGVTILHDDIIARINPLFSACYSRIYSFLMHSRPGTLRSIYASLEKRYNNPSAKKSISVVNLFGTRRIARYIASYNPDHIICTHCLAAEIVADLMENRQVKKTMLWVVINDYAFYSWWVQKHVSGYFVPSEEAADALRSFCGNNTMVHVTGLPVLSGFSHPQSRTENAKEFSIDPKIFTVLLMAGGGGTGPVMSLTTALKSCTADIQVIILAGNNSRLLKRLIRLKNHNMNNIYPLGFIPHVDQAMACADLVITKPGGSTVSECTAMGTPLLLVSPAPMLEEENAAWLLNKGAARYITDTASLPEAVDHLARNPTAREALSTASQQCGKPNAARDVLDIILSSTSKK